MIPLTKSKLKLDCISKILPKQIKLKLENEIDYETTFQQPIGKKQAITCLLDRYNCLKNQSKNDWNKCIIVGIENYIQESECKKYWCDNCMIMLINNENILLYDSKVFEARVEKSIIGNFDNKKTTIGKILSNKYSNIKHDDWFRSMGHIYDREMQIIDSFEPVFKDYFLTKELKNEMKSFNNFPKKGINFLDIFSIMARKGGVKLLVNIMEKNIKSQLDLTGINSNDYFIVGLDSRGLALGMALADRLNCPFMPVRKLGKLPGKVLTNTFTKEYGKDSFSIQMEYTFPPNAIIVDDILATGGSINAAIELIEKYKKNVLFSVTLLDILELREQWQKLLKNQKVVICM